MSSFRDLNFTCHSDLHFGKTRLFGFECFAPLDPVYESMLGGSKSTEKVDSLPSCENVCESSSSSQPDYEQFMSLNRTKLLSFCGSSTKQVYRAMSDVQCQFNVVVDFDFDKLAWTTKSGEPIETINWSKGGYPWFNDKLDMIVFELVAIFNSCSKNF